MQTKFSKLSFFIAVLLMPVFLTMCRVQQVEQSRIKLDSLSAKPAVFWWWMGGAVNENGLRQRLAEMDSVGVGTAGVVMIYGVQGEQEDYRPLFSDAWVKAFNQACAIADSLDMKIDVTPGSGWPYGGPHITFEHAARRLHLVSYTPEELYKLNYRIVHQDSLAIPLALSLFDSTGVYIKSLQPEKQPFKLSVIDNNATLWVAWAVPTYQQVKRSAPGGKGLVMDYFSSQALHTYLEPWDAILAADTLPLQLPHAFYHDSYEVYKANITPTFFAQFKNLRGYDLARYLPYLYPSATDELSLRILYDYRMTIDDLLYREFTSNLSRWCKEHGTLLRNQAHGSPANLLDLYALADIPETEAFGSSDFGIPGVRTDTLYDPKQFGRPDPLVMKMASSPAHLYAKPLVSAESFTWLGNHYSVAPSQIKPEIDQLFISGINAIYYHGMTYSPPEEGFPGRAFYAATHFGPQTLLFRDIKDMNNYITYCQRVLQNTLPDNDILLYFPIHDLYSQQHDDLLVQLDVHHPEDWFYVSAFGQTAKTLQEAGYTFDYLSDRQLMTLQIDDQARIYGQDASRYQVIVVPECRYMPLKSLKKLNELIRKGATVVFVKNLPEDVPGFYKHDKRRQRLKNITDNMQQQSRVVVCENLKDGLAGLHIRREPMADVGLQFIRKTTPNSTLYFVTNLMESPVDQVVRINTDISYVLLTKPLDKATACFHRDSLRLCLQAGESCFLETYPAIDSIKKPTVGMFNILPDKPIPFSGGWEVSFADGYPMVLPTQDSVKLTSWTEFGEDYAYYSGTASYQTTISLPEKLPQAYLLRFDQLHESAAVSINGKYVGKVWAAPFQIVIDKSFLMPGTENVVKVEVTNLAINYIRYLDQQAVSWKRFEDINIVDVRYKPFDATKLQPAPSGIIGQPVLIPMQKIYGLSDE